MAGLNDNSIIELVDIAGKDTDLSTLDDIIELTDVAKNKNTNFDTEDEFELEISKSKDYEVLNTNFDTDTDAKIDAKIDSDKFTDETTNNSETKAYDEFIDTDTNNELEPDEIDFDTSKPDNTDNTNEIVPHEDYVAIEKEKILPSDLKIDQDQVEIILERIIEKKFGAKIESILFEAMENVIEKQIIEIKESLQNNLDQIDNN